MKRTQPNRALLLVAPPPDAEVVFKRMTPLPPGCMVYTVSYFKSIKPPDSPVKKRRFLPQFALIFSRIRAVLREKLGGLRVRVLS